MKAKWILPVTFLIGLPFGVILFDTHSFALTILASLPTIIMCLWFVVLPRIKMERRAKTLLAETPEHDSTIIYLAFASALPWKKRAAMESKIAEIEEKNGWVFLKASESSPLKTVSSRGGGLDLHFIKGLAKSPTAIV